VTGWTGGNGYQLYFVNGTATVDSANSQYDNGYNTGSEKFYTMPGSPTGGSGNFVALDGDQTSGIQGSISQTISGLTIGASYTVTFDWATGQLQSRSGATTDNVNVSFGGQNSPPRRSAMPARARPRGCSSHSFIPPPARPRR
jgi:hypothetical protein